MVSTTSIKIIQMFVKVIVNKLKLSWILSICAVTKYQIEETIKICDLIIMKENYLGHTDTWWDKKNT